MNWFRKHIKTGSRLALFTLAIQFALSFGHFHALAAPVIRSGLTQVDLARAKGLAADTTSETAQQQQPANQDNDQQPADGCAICAVMSLAGTMLFATPPLLELPQAVEFLYRTTDAEFVHLHSAHLAFQSRAPPAS
jgi:Protein of unknown function (DUF2946)